MSTTINLPISYFTDLTPHELPYQITYTSSPEIAGAVWSGPTGCTTTLTTCTFECSNTSEVMSKSTQVNFTVPNDYYLPVTIYLTMYDGVRTKNYSETINGIPKPLVFASRSSGTYTQSQNEDSALAKFIKLDLLQIADKVYQDIVVTITSTNLPNAWNTSNIAAGVTATTVGNVVTFSGVRTVEQFNSIALCYVPIPHDWNGTYSYSVHVYDQVHQDPIDYTVNVTFVDTADVSPLTVSAVSYNEDTNRVFTDVNMPQIVDLPSDDNTPGYQCEVVLPSGDLGVITTNEPGSCTVGWNPLTYTFTILGTKGAVNTAVRNLVFGPYADVNTNFAIDLKFKYLLSPQTTTVSITMNGIGSGEYTVPAQQNYNEDLSQTWTTPPQVIDAAINKTYLVYITADHATFDSTGTGYWEITDSKANVNAALSALHWTPDPDYNGLITFEYNQFQQTDGKTHAENVAFTCQGIASAETSNKDQTYNYIEDTPLTLTSVPQIIDAAVGKNYTITVEPVGVNYGTLSSTLGTSYGPNWTYTGSKANCNTALQNLVFTPNADVFSDFNAVYTQVQSTNMITQTTGNWTFYGTGMPETSGHTGGRTSIKNEIYAFDPIIQIVDNDLNNPTYNVKIVWNRDSGYLSSTNISGNRSVFTWEMTGSKSDINAELASLKWYPDVDSLFTVNFEYTQKKNSVTQTYVSFDMTVTDAGYFTGGTTPQTILEDAAITTVTDIPTSHPYWGYTGYILIEARDVGNVLQTGVTLSTTNHSGAGTIQIPYSAPLMPADRTALQTELNSLQALLAADYATNFTLSYKLYYNNLGTPTELASVSKAITVTPSAEYTIDVAYQVYDEDVSINMNNVPQIIDAAVGKTYTVKVQPDVANVGSFTNLGNGWNGTYWSFTGTKSECNTALNDLTYNPAADYNGSFTATYTQNQDTDGINQANITLSFSGVGSDEYTSTVSTFNFTEDVLLNTVGMPQIADVATGKTYTVTLQVNSPRVGMFAAINGSAEHGVWHESFNKWYKTGTKAECNAALNNLNFVSAPDYNGTFTVTYTQHQDTDNITQATVNLTFVGTGSNEITLPGTYTYYEDTDMLVAGVSILDTAWDNNYQQIGSYIWPDTYRASRINHQVKLRVDDQTKGYLVAPSLIGSLVGGLYTLNDSSVELHLIGLASEINSYLSTVKFRQSQDYSGNNLMTLYVARNGLTQRIPDLSVPTTGTPNTYELTITPTVAGSIIIRHPLSNSGWDGSKYTLTFTATSNSSTSVSTANTALNSLIVYPQAGWTGDGSVTITFKNTTTNTVISSQEMPFNSVVLADNVSLPITGVNCYDPAIQLRLINGAGQNVTSVHNFDTAWYMQADATGLPSPTADQVNINSVSVDITTAYFNITTTTPVTGSVRKKYTPKSYTTDPNLWTQRTLSAATNGSPGVYNPQAVSYQLGYQQWNWWTDTFNSAYTLNATKGTGNLVTGATTFTTTVATTGYGVTGYKRSFTGTKTTNGANTIVTLNFTLPYWGQHSNMSDWNATNFALDSLNITCHTYGMIQHSLARLPFHNGTPGTTAETTHYNETSSEVKINGTTIWKHNFGDNGYATNTSYNAAPILTVSAAAQSGAFQSTVSSLIPVTVIIEGPTSELFSATSPLLNDEFGLRLKVTINGVTTMLPYLLFSITS